MVAFSVLAASPAWAQIASEPQIPAPAQGSTSAQDPAHTQINIPEGTEFSVRIDEALSSSSASEGDRFTITLEEDVKLPDGTVLLAGYHGVGEVVEAQDNGMLAKSGKLNIRLVYLKVGDVRIKLRANKGAEGDIRIGATVATVILFWPAAPFIKGKDVSIKKGTIMRAYAEQDTVLSSPVTPPPPEVD